MQIAQNILMGLIALEFLFIMYLETFATTSKQTARVFNTTQAKLEDSQVQNLFKNLGIYNGLLAGVIIFALVLQHNLVLTYIAFYIVGVALYGAFTVSKHIIWKQGGLAIIYLVLHFLN